MTTERDEKAIEAFPFGGMGTHRINVGSARIGFKAGWDARDEAVRAKEKEQLRVAMDATNRAVEAERRCQEQYTEMQKEIERLRAALRAIAGVDNPVIMGWSMRDAAKEALAPQREKEPG